MPEFLPGDAFWLSKYLNFVCKLKDFIVSCYSLDKVHIPILCERFFL